MNEKNRLICEILQLAYLVDALTDYCVFIDYSGHVSQLEIRIRESKKNWQVNVLETEFYTVYKDYMDNRGDLAFYKAKRDILLRILNESEIPYEDCDVEQYMVEELKF